MSSPLLGGLPGSGHGHSGLLRWPSFLQPAISESEGERTGTDSLDSTRNGQPLSDAQVGEVAAGGMNSAPGIGAGAGGGGGAGGKWVAECFTGAAGQVRDEQEQELTPLRSDVERGEGGGEDERRSGRSGSGGEMRMASGERTRVSSPPLAAATAAATAAPDGQPAVPAGARSARANERSMSEVALQLSVFGFEVRCAARRECARGSSKAP